MHESSWIEYHDDPRGEIIHKSRLALTLRIGYVELDAVELVNKALAVCISLFGVKR